MMGWYDDAGSGGWLVMMLVMLAFWVLVVAGIVAVLRWTGTPQNNRPVRPADGPSEKAQALLDERFARGEIDEAEYNSRRTALRGKA